MFQEVVRTGPGAQAGGGSILNLTPRRTDNMHANARLTPLMRAEMITQFISQNLSRRAVATAFHVSDRTLRRWLQRAIQADFPSRLHDRSCVPRRQPRKTNSRLLTRILRLRRQRRSYAQILTVLRVSKATTPGLAPPRSPPPLRPRSQASGSPLRTRSARRLASSRHQETRPL